MAGFLFVGGGGSRRRKSRTSFYIANAALASPEELRPTARPPARSRSRSTTGCSNLRHCEERSDEAIQSPTPSLGLHHRARNDACRSVQLEKLTRHLRMRLVRTMRTNPRDLAAPHPSVRGEGSDCSDLPATLDRARSPLY